MLYWKYCLYSQHDHQPSNSVDWQIEGGPPIHPLHCFSFLPFCLACCL